MPSTTRYRFGDVLLVPFPFTNQTSSKRRPATVVSADAYNQKFQDVIVMAIPSDLAQGQRLGAVTVRDWRASGLPKPSVTKPVVTSLEVGLIQKRLGHLDPQTKEDVRKALRKILG